MIVLWGVPGDAPLDAVLAALERAGADFRLVDQRRAPDMQVNLVIQPGGRLTGSLTDPDGEIDFNDVGSAYIRPLDTSTACGIDTKDDPAFVRAIHADSRLIAWGDLSSSFIVNRPSAMASNNSKPYQLALIAKFGLTVPQTLVTTSASAAREFHQRHERIIYKSVSGVRSIVSQVTASDQDFQNIANCVTQFQEYIPGVDVRVHVMGGETIATLISSAADDYRYASRYDIGVTMTPIELPAPIEIACTNMVRGMGLQLAGIDFRLTPGGDWYCLEVNPSPGFTFFEGVTGQPIAAAVANLLVQLDRDSLMVL